MEQYELDAIAAADELLDAAKGAALLAEMDADFVPTSEQVEDAADLCDLSDQDAPENAPVVDEDDLWRQDQRQMQNDIERGEY